MALMILLMKEKDLGRGCASCRFIDTLETTAKCIADERVCVYKNGEINTYRPYGCPFRYYDHSINQFINRFQGMTEEETKGWFKGADHQARRQWLLEKERDRFVQSEEYRNCVKHDLPNEVQDNKDKWIDHTLRQGDNIECPFCHKTWNVIDNCTETFDYCPGCGKKLS